MKANTNANITTATVTVSATGAAATVTSTSSATATAVFVAAATAAAATATATATARRSGTVTTSATVATATTATSTASSTATTAADVAAAAAADDDDDDDLSTVIRISETTRMLLKIFIGDGNGTFLQSAVSRHWDRALYTSLPGRPVRSNAISTSLGSIQPVIQITELWKCGEKKIAKVSKWQQKDSNPGSVD